ncbi:hypothetical protein GEMRC1_002850 [Eukaryota sp. GEM-RC1]
MLEDNLDCMRDGTSLIFFMPPPAKYIVMVPTKFENFFRKFDDSIIRFLQSFFNTFWLVFDLLITFFTTVEFGMVFSFVLLFGGLDSLEGETTYIVLIVCLFSQIPKRFLWRSRPFMVGRSAPYSKPKTSSIPSRAVTCATVYACSFMYYQGLSPAGYVFSFKYLAYPIIFIILSSHSRIQLGCHYPSDCLIGAFNGIVSAIFGSALNFMLTLGCGSCFDGSCYAPSHGSNTITWARLDLVNWKFFWLVFGLGIFLTLISTIKPIRFLV